MIPLSAFIRAGHLLHRWLHDPHQQDLRLVRSERKSLERQIDADAFRLLHLRQLMPWDRERLAGQRWLLLGVEDALRQSPSRVNYAPPSFQRFYLDGRERSVQVVERLRQGVSIEAVIAEIAVDAAVSAVEPEIDQLARFDAIDNASAFAAIRRLAQAHREKQEGGGDDA